MPHTLYTVSSVCSTLLVGVIAYLLLGTGEVAALVAGTVGLAVCHVLGQLAGRWLP